MRGIARVESPKRYGGIWHLMAAYGEQHATRRDILYPNVDDARCFGQPRSSLAEGSGHMASDKHGLELPVSQYRATADISFLDPLLCRLLHPSQDLAISTHLMDTLAAFVQYGGESLGKACQNCETDQSPYTQVSSSKQPYMDLIVDVLSQ